MSSTSGKDDEKGVDIFDHGHMDGLVDTPTPPRRPGPEPEPCGKPLTLKDGRQVPCAKLRGHESQGIECGRSFADEFSDAYRATLNEDASEHGDFSNNGDE